MESFISDLALILISASLVTLVFKRLKQPLVLGYIVAGFLAGPHMPYTPSVSDMSSIHTWADIGVIFLMFTLGLEFSFKKIVKMGIGPVIAACSVMFCMMSVGNMVGHMFGWGSMNSLFLGGMLAMSSTTIIYKAFDDLGLRQQKFAGEVLSVLILEDILGILLMVVLSALAVSRQFQGMELVGSLFKLGFFLILWFVVGVYIIPIFLRRTHRFLNKETLLVVSIGLCFLLVVIAGKVGYSSAFGAFMMGSILAETVEAEKIERVVSPVKDLFGAIFFVSVGMLVDPAVLAAYWLPIVVLCIAIIVGQAVFGTTSFLLSGQPLRIAVQGGFSLAQIGEFAFIIASLGISLGVTSDFLYPVVVAVSIITTFFTPYMIRAAQPACRLLERVVPQNVMHRLMERGTHAGGQSAVAATDGVWKRLLMALVSQVVDAAADDHARYKVLCYPEADSYFNAGVLLIDLDWWRANNVGQRCIDYYRAHPERIRFNDQDLLNSIFHGQVCWAPLRYNAQEGFYRQRYAHYSQHKAELHHPVVVHYTNRKPWDWDSLHPMRQLFFHYQQYTPWRGRNILHNPLWLVARWLKLLPYTLHLRKARYRRGIPLPQPAANA